MPWRVLIVVWILIGALVWLLFGGEKPGEVRARSDARSEVEANPEAAELGEPVEQGTRQLEPHAPAPEAPAIEPDREILVRVVDDLGAPVHEAELAVSWWLRGETAAADREAEAWAGATTWSDQQGLARIAIREHAHQVLVFARKSGVWGRGVLRDFRGELEVTVTLKIDLTLLVQVQDDLGRPLAGVNVLVSKREDAGTRFGFYYGTSEGADGMVRFDHIQERFPDDFDGAAVVQFVAPSISPQMVFVDLHPPPLEPVVLRLPELGGLRLRMVDADGLPVGELSENLTIGDFLEPSVVRLEYRDDEGVIREFPISFTGDQVELFPIGTGVEFRLEIESVLMRGTSDWFAGPQRSGDWVDHDVEVEVLPVLSGRLLDRAGTPLAGYWLATGIRPGQATYNQYFETKEDGTFLVPFPTIDDEVREQLSVVFRPSARDRTEPSQFIDGSAFRWYPGINELGDVVMGELPILAQGRVLKRDGSAAPGVTVVVLHGETGGDLYSTSWVKSVSSDDEGGFTLRGFFPHAHDFVLATQGGGHQRCRVGSLDVVCWSD